MGFIKPETNVPIVGMLQYADLAKGNYGDQVKLKGEWEGFGKDDSGIFLPESAVRKLVDCGAIEETDQVDQKTNLPKLKVLGRPKIQILKVGDGNRTSYEITKLSGGGGGQNGHQKAAGSQEPRRFGSAGSSVVNDRQPQDPKSQVQQIKLTMIACLIHSREIWERAIEAWQKADAKAMEAGKGILLQPLAPTIDQISATATSLFIHRVREGLLSPAPKSDTPPAPPPPPPPPPITDAQKDEIDRLGQALGWTGQQIEQHIQTTTQATDPYHITADQAAVAIKAMAAEVARRAEQARQQVSVGPTGGYAEEDIPF